MNTERCSQAPALSYADEVLCANWHPQVQLLTEAPPRLQQAVLAASDAEEFLAHFYVAQRA